MEENPKKRGSMYTYSWFTSTVQQKPPRPCEVRKNAKLWVAQSCPTLCEPIGCSPPGSSVHGDSPVKNTGVGYHFLLQGIFSSQGLNLGLLHCRQILYHLSHQRSPIPQLKKNKDRKKHFLKKEGMVLIYSGILLSHKKKEMTPFAATGTHLELSGLVKWVTQIYGVLCLWDLKQCNIYEIDIDLYT